MAHEEEEEEETNSTGEEDYPRNEYWLYNLLIEQLKRLIAWLLSHVEENILLKLIGLNLLILGIWLQRIGNIKANAS